MLHNCLLQIAHIFRFARIGLVVREGAVKFEIEGHDLATEFRENARNEGAGHAVASIDRDFEWLDRCRIDQVDHVLGVVIEDVACNNIAATIGARESRWQAPDRGFGEYLGQTRGRALLRGRS